MARQTGTISCVATCEDGNTSRYTSYMNWVWVDGTFTLDWWLQSAVPSVFTSFPSSTYSALISVAGTQHTFNTPAITVNNSSWVKLGSIRIVNWTSGARNIWCAFTSNITLGAFALKSISGSQTLTFNLDTNVNLINVYNGTAQQLVNEVQVHNGYSFVPSQQVFVFDGSSWQKVKG